jgi:hypothetical protein
MDLERSLGNVQTIKIFLDRSLCISIDLPIADIDLYFALFHNEGSMKGRQTASVAYGYWGETQPPGKPKYMPHQPECFVRRAKFTPRASNTVNAGFRETESGKGHWFGPKKKNRDRSKVTHIVSNVVGGSSVLDPTLHWISDKPHDP